MSAKDKIEIGVPFMIPGKGVLSVPIKFNYPDGTSWESAFNYSEGTDPDYIEHNIKQIYQERWKRKSEPKDYSKLAGKKFKKVTQFESEELLPP
jgi:hypothetical protein